VLSLPVLGTVPVVRTGDDTRVSRRVRVLGWTFAAACVSLTAAAVAWKFRGVIEGWVR